GLGGSSPAFVASALLVDENMHPGRSILVILPDEEDADTFRYDVQDIIGSDLVKYFPERDTSPYEHVDSHVEIRSQRVETIELLDSGWKGIVVTSVSALHDPTTPPGIIQMASMRVNTGEKIDFGEFIRSLVRKGFKRQNTVDSAGQIAVRGGILDIFPYGCDVPYRIEFWGDEIESIRTFSTTTQRSIDTVSHFKIIPPDEFVTEAGINPSDENRINEIEKREKIHLKRIRDAIDGGERSNGLEQYLYVVFGERASIDAYFTSNDIVIVFDPELCMENLRNKMKHAQISYEREKIDYHDIPSPEYLFKSPEKLMERLGELMLVKNYYLKPSDKSAIHFNILPSRQYQSNLDELRKDILNFESNRKICHIACDNTGQAERLNELIEDIDGHYTIDISRISGGFTDKESGIMLLTDHEIFGRHRRKIRYRRYKGGIPIPDYRALTLGDFVVHVDYGIGKYMGLKRITVGEAERDCLLVEYKGNDKVYVPVEQINRLKKYTSEEGVIPIINKLGGTAWEKLKERTKKSIQRLATELLRLYAKRKAFDGYAFSPDERMLSALEESFIYEETPDQRKTWIEVHKDMENKSPMERLICGDVGFGKTEIAMRAAFLAVLNNKQVVMLAPTTILTEQHDKTFKERLADFPVNVGSISRFRSRAEQKAILDKLAEGKIDIIIGTHRLLSKDVHIKNIGLLIVDEEQQFGVKHKERIKKIQQNIDVLSMSATPIPRTLNMSLLGARDISFINTPPIDRLSVHTEVLPFDEKYIIEAIMREIDRDGQVFFVHNRVRSIERMASYLRNLLPNVTFGVAHGQLKEKDLEKIMYDFYHKKFQVLVSTMIIENGLDIPNVNTIIINRADTFGLSQLYQLRGRVGRSSKKAYAYLLVPPKVPLSKIARKRLRTIEEFAEIGSGFHIAMRDLELRGAGNILGTQQSGFIASVGFDLYCELLQETIAELKGEKVEKPPEVEVHVKIDSYFPDTYIPVAKERVLFYRRLAETITYDDVGEIESELIDRYGRPDEAVKNLLDTSYIRHYAALIDASDVYCNKDETSIYIPEGIDVSRDKIEKIVKKSPVRLHFSFSDGMIIKFNPPTGLSGNLSGVKKVLQAIVT
ncbi:transcription-repair coupling factor, partial [Candidatus Latescibacterota bacterium]